MKVKNDVIIIQNGKKTYEFNNLILDAYLSRFAKRQIDASGYDKVTTLLDLEYCMLKFDEPLEFDASTKVNNEDFNICNMDAGAAGYHNPDQILNNSKCSIKYQFEFNENTTIYDYNARSQKNLSDYYGRRITAIGFNGFWTPSRPDAPAWDVPVCAVLDTSNYNIYLQENQIFTVTRKDSISSDALFWSSDFEKVPGACHIAPKGGPQVIYQPDIIGQGGTARAKFYDNAFGIIYSVGLSNSIDRMDKEYVIGEDVQMEQDGTSLIIKNIGNEDSVARTFLSKFLPFFPTRGNYKYYLIKYKVWQQVHSGTYDDIITTNTDTGYYYHMAIPTNGTGNKDIIISYERS